MNRAGRELAWFLPWALFTVALLATHHRTTPLSQHDASQHMVFVPETTQWMFHVLDAPGLGGSCRFEGVRASGVRAEVRWTNNGVALSNATVVLVQADGPEAIVTVPDDLRAACPEASARTQTLAHLSEAPVRTTASMVRAVRLPLGAAKWCWVLVALLLTVLTRVVASGLRELDSKSNLTM